ncbi:MAG: hypothetical protein NTZ85_01825 [Bacteroidia bacterium]|nr:hypothetical protein [Bacteroidia bacterium]
MSFQILSIIIATLFIIGLNVFLFRKKIYDLLDIQAMWASDFSKSVCLTFLAIVIIYLYGFYNEAFPEPTIIGNALIFFSLIAGMVFALYGMGLKKRWFMFFWLGVVVSSIVITYILIDPNTIPFPIWSLVILGLMWMNLHLYNKEKVGFYI